MFSRGGYAQLKQAVEAIGACVAILAVGEGTLRFLVANRRFEQMLDLDPQQLIDRSPEQVFPPDWLEQYRYHLELCFEKAEAVEFEVALERRAGPRWWRVVLSPVFDNRQRLVRVFNTCIDISDRKRLEQALERSHQRFEAVIQSAYDGIVAIDAHQRIRLINRTAQQLFQVSEAEVLGESLNLLIPPRWHHQHEAFVTAFRDSAERARPMHAREPVVGVRRDGSEFPCEVSLAKIQVDDHIEMTAVIRDISEQSRLIEELRVLASTDSLTGLCNRRKMLEYIEEEVARVARFRRTMSLVIFDIDRFKRINDTYGHPVGDRVIVEVGRVVQAQLRRTDKLGRIGGEEFLILLPETAAREARIQAERLRACLEALRIPLEGGEEIDVTASFGVIELQDVDSSVDTLIRDADIALYEAKKQGRNRVVCFDSSF